MKNSIFNQASPLLYYSIIVKRHTFQKFLLSTDRGREEEGVSFRPPSFPPLTVRETYYLPPVGG